jgi:hypothetical protein
MTNLIVNQERIDSADTRSLLEMQSGETRRNAGISTRTVFPTLSAETRKTGKVSQVVRPRFSELILNRVILACQEFSAGK